MAFEEPSYCFLNPGTLFVNDDLRALERGAPLDAETYLRARGDPPKRWPPAHLPLLLGKLAKVKLLTKEQLYDIFLPKHLLTEEVGQAPMFLEAE